jgi:hypothetical protein
MDIVRRGGRLNVGEVGGDSSGRQRWRQREKKRRNERYVLPPLHCVDIGAHYKEIRLMFKTPRSLQLAVLKHIPLHSTATNTWSISYRRNPSIVYTACVRGPS